MADFIQSSWERNADGTYTIHDVPILELGNVKGFDLDEEWADKAVRYFESLKSSKGYLPSVFVGHNPYDEDAPEKPAVGLMDNLRRIGKTIIADLTRIGSETFDQIKAGMWPYRSIEFFPKNAEITGIALLGSREPYIKTPPLHFAAESDKEGDALSAVVSEVPVTLSTKEPEAMADQEKPQDGVAQESVSPERLSELEERIAQLTADLEKSRSEVTKTSEQLAVEKARADELERARRTERVELFRERVTSTHGIAPALTEHPVFALMLDSFSTSETPVKLTAGEEEREVVGLDALESFIAAIREQHDKHALFVDLNEHGRVDDVKPTDEKAEEDLSPDERITKLSKEKVDNPEWQPNVSGQARWPLAIAEAKKEAK